MILRNRYRTFSLLLLAIASLATVVYGGCEQGNQVQVEEEAAPPKVESLSVSEPQVQVDPLRQPLIDAIWGKTTLGALGSADLVVVNVAEPAWKDVQGIGRMDVLRFNMSHGIASIAYLFTPASASATPPPPTRPLVIYHQGHLGDPIHGSTMISKFLQQGYTVMAFAMPLLGPNSAVDVKLSTGEDLHIVTHDDLKPLEQDGVETFRYFLEPVIRGINYSIVHLGIKDFVMLGISGGGWATTFCSAIDTRIRRSYPVAGSIPFALRDLSIGEEGDFEQLAERPFFKLTNYLGLYYLGAQGSNRRQVQIYNKYDPCCYNTEKREPAIRQYEADIQAELAKSGGGSFQVIIDDTHTEHAISEAMMQFILKDVAAP